MRRRIRAAFGLALVLAMIVSMASIASAKETASIQVYGNIMITGRAEEPYHIIYNANGGTGNYIGPDVAAGGTDTVLTVSATGIDREGCVFVGWNTTADGSGAFCAPGECITLTSNVTLYAQWAAPEIVTAPKTGNTGNIGLLAGMLCASLTALVLLVRMARREKHHET